MPEWFTYTLIILGAIQSCRILDGLICVIGAMRKKIDLQSEALQGALQLQSMQLEQLLAEEKDQTPRFGTN